MSDLLKALIYDIQREKSHEAIQKLISFYVKDISKDEVICYKNTIEDLKKNLVRQDRQLEELHDEVRFFESKNSNLECEIADLRDEIEYAEDNGCCCGNC